MLITINDDFDMKKIADSGQCFRCRDMDGTYRFMTGGNVVYLKKISDTKYDASCSLGEWESLWTPYFDLDRNYGQIRENAFKSDHFISCAAEYGRGVRILRQDPWETLVTFIISQRKSIPAIKKAVEALSASCGESMDTGRELLYSFPTPEAVVAAGEQTLAACGLGYRISYVADAAAKVAEGVMDLKKLADTDSETMAETLKSIRGVGDKVAGCIMLFAYGRTACVPVDTWIKKIIAEKYAGKNVFLDFGENGGIAQQYAFYYILNHKDEV